MGALTVNLRHEGPTADVIVQAYMSFVNASVPVPKIQLVAFTKEYNVSDGEQRSVTLSVAAARRAIITNEPFVRTVEPQSAKFWVGARPDSQTPGVVVDFTGMPTALSDCVSRDGGDSTQFV